MSDAKSRLFDGQSSASNKRPSAVETVIEEIKTLLKNGQLRPGDKIPNELELSRIFAISRGPIREAVRALVALGILEIRRGDGTYISDSSPTTAVDHLLFHILLDRPQLKEIRDLRYMIELGMVEMLLTNIEEQDVEELESINREMEELIDSGSREVELISQLDVAFHKKIGHSTRNRLVEKIYDFTLELFSPTIEQTHAMPNAGNISSDVHKAILSGIKQRDHDKTRAAIVRSLKVWEDLSS